MRPSYASRFRYDKKIRVYFYTSNIDKYMQARLIFSRFGYDLQITKSNYEPYEENYQAGTRGLLRNAVGQLTGEQRKQTCFFIEDTSLRIDALSDMEDYPGVRVKEWFSSINFEELDTNLKKLGRGRGVCVKSDIAFYMPGLSEPIYCYGETRGTVCESRPNFRTNPIYPWLSAESFNGWFVPEGSNKRLGEMEFEESLNYDFRAKSISCLIEKIDALNAALNLSPAYYSTSKEKGVNPKNFQFSLFRLQGVTIVVYGPKCAGKSTLGDYLVKKGGV